ncbi:hypothetical protein H5410_060740 [Solanum commersonii]|uniref:Uncharacterized protein n=1 Tax=Solanum commersonii TaxID=4109 RepID=A0A9J5W7H3_SOLCO|nr:hypothetical protein H5410_060740 [Solanum commersonii]
MAGVDPPLAKVSTKVPMGTHRHEPTMEIARQEHLLAATIPRHKPASVELGRFRDDNSKAWIFQAERYFIELKKIKG